MRDDSRSRAGASRVAGRAGRGLARTGPAVVRSWRVLVLEQRAAAVAAVLLAVSTLGAFSWVEAAILLVCFGVLLLLKKRADGAEFHLPFGDGTVIAAAGAWSAVLVVVRLFDRPAGQGLLALVLAALLLGAGLRERARRPDDDVPPAARDDELDDDWSTVPAPDRARAWRRRPRRREARGSTGVSTEPPTEPLPGRARPPERRRSAAPPGEDREPPTVALDLDEPPEPPAFGARGGDQETGSGRPPSSSAER